MIPLQRREGVLDYSRYFQTKRQMVVFEENFNGRAVIPPKVLDFPFFVTFDFSVSRIFELPRIATLS